MPRGKKPATGLSESSAKWQSATHTTERVDLQLGPGGRIVIPAAFRKAMQVKEGDRLMARVVDGELQVLTPTMGVRKAQRMVRESIPADVDLVGSLFEERRREYEQELADDEGRP